MRTKMPALTRTLLPVAVGAGCMITFLCIANGIGAIIHTAPRPGDIISFQATASIPSDGGLLIPVRRAHGQQDCTLDLDTLRHLGGSLVIESEVNRIAAAFQVHWAGERTASAGADCGGNATLIVQASDLDMLALSAGGYGGGEKHPDVSKGRSSK